VYTKKSARREREFKREFERESSREREFEREKKKTNKETQRQKRDTNHLNQIAMHVKDRIRDHLEQGAEQLFIAFSSNEPFRDSAHAGGINVCVRVYECERTRECEGIRVCM
jgi:LPS O-antigen subunit length determinant protein (WzzB/FepE family)